MIIVTKVSGIAAFGCMMLWPMQVLCLNLARLTATPPLPSGKTQFFIFLHMGWWYHLPCDTNRSGAGVTGRRMGRWDAIISPLSFTNRSGHPHCLSVHTNVPRARLESELNTSLVKSNKKSGPSKYRFVFTSHTIEITQKIQKLFWPQGTYLKIF